MQPGGQSRLHTQAPRYRMLVLDLDGTLLDSQGQLRSETVAAVRGAAAHGCRVILATGRDGTGVLEVAEKLQLQQPLILHNGTQIRWSWDEVWHESVVPDAVLARLCAAGRQWDVSWFAYGDGADEPVYFSRPPSHSRARRYLRRLGPRAHHTPDLLADPAVGGILRLVALAPRERAEALTDWLHADLARDLKVISAPDPPHGRYVEVYARHGTKGHAVARLARRLDVPRAAVLAVGDWLNDLEMLRFAGMGIAMGNAAAEVKEMANRVGADNDAGGVAQIIHDYILAPGACG